MAFMQSSDTVNQDIDLGKIKLYFFTIRTILSFVVVHTEIQM